MARVGAEVTQYAGTCGMLSVSWLVWFEKMNIIRMPLEHMLADQRKSL